MPGEQSKDPGGTVCIHEMSLSESAASTAHRSSGPFHVSSKKISACRVAVARQNRITGERDHGPGGTSIITAILQHTKRDFGQEGNIGLVDYIIFFGG